MLSRANNVEPLTSLYDQSVATAATP